MTVLQMINNSIDELNINKSELQLRKHVLIARLKVIKAIVAKYDLNKDYSDEEIIEIINSENN